MYTIRNMTTVVLSAVFFFMMSTAKAESTCPVGERRLSAGDDCIPQHMYLYLYCLVRSNNGLVQMKQMGSSSDGKTYEVKGGGKVSGLVVSGQVTADVSNARSSAVGQALEKTLSPDLAKYCRELATTAPPLAPIAQDASSTSFEQIKLADDFFFGRNGVVASDVDAIKWYRKAAEEGSAYAQSKLGFMYQYGRGIERSDTAAVKWYRKSAEQGFAWSQMQLAGFYRSGSGGLVQSDSDAVTWYRKSAEQGEARAQSLLGEMYFGGLGGLSQSYNDATIWFRKSARQGDSIGEDYLGLMYRAGRAGTGEMSLKNNERALNLFIRAAKQGNEKAEYHIGMMYWFGVGGIPRDNWETRWWWTRAASHGSNDAASELARVGGELSKREFIAEEHPNEWATKELKILKER